MRIEKHSIGLQRIQTITIMAFIMLAYERETEARWREYAAQGGKC